ncbi:MAG: hypothetical protein OHK0039_38350 [Bacteroidia bacterium]
MFNFFKKKSPAIPIDDQVYMDMGGKMHAITALWGGAAPVWVLCWFEDTFDQTLARLQADGMSVGGVRSRGQSPAGLPAAVVVAMVDALPEPDRLERQSPAPAALVFAERHPLAETEAGMAARLHGVFPGARIVRLSSLDEALFADMRNLQALMHRLGVEPNEALSHPMIAKSIERLQKKNERKVYGAEVRSSQADWLRLNQPG